MKIERWFRKRVVLPLGAALVVGLGLYRSSPSPAQNPASEAAPHQPPAAILAQLAGTPSCSARGCHGAVEPVQEPGKFQQNEYNQWVRDPHADAYQVLFNERSQNIAKLLDSPKAHEDVRCLACHTNPQVAGLPASLFVREEQSFGVGCESCHGSASSWLAAHTAPDWRNKKSSYSMRDLSDPVVQAKTCAGCHVGAPAEKDAPARDVNHDLIAAGHPRLNFEFGAFHANMPRHWRPKDISEGQLWAVGQVASAEAALQLLAYRAEPEKYPHWKGFEKPPWPEFAEYDCYACHHSLAQPSWRQAAETHGRRPGALPWGSWYYALLRPLGADLPALHGKQGLAAIMERPNPDRAKAAAKARTALAEAQQFLGPLAKSHRGEDDVKRLHVLLAEAQRTGIPSWDRAEQLYLALHALNQAQPRADVTRVLQELTPLRVFPPDFSSPASWPQNKEFPFDPQKFAEKLLPLTK